MKPACKGLKLTGLSIAIRDDYSSSPGELKMLKWNKYRSFLLLVPMILTSLFLSELNLGAQAPVPAASPAGASNRFMGTITATSSGMLTVRTDAGLERKVTVPEGIRLQRIAPGQKDLSNATTIEFGALAVGDRVLVRIAPDPATDPVTALSIVVIPQADLAQKQQRERENWQRNGVGGLVKSVDTGTGIVVITSGAGVTTKTTALHTSPTTILRRYSADSVSFDQAKPAPIAVIQVGDQLRARGEKNQDGTEIVAEEVVSGSFRNIAGTVTSVNATGMTIMVRDLATKQTVTVHVGADLQMRKLPEGMAKTMAAPVKPVEAAPGTVPAADSATRAGDAAGMGMPRTEVAAPGTGASAPGWQGRNSGGQTGGNGGSGGEGRPTGPQDLQQMISRAPVIHLADLQKGDAVMLVSTQGTGDVTAVTLLAGVDLSVNGQALDAQDLGWG